MLLDVAEKHRGAVEYDWRARFHLPFADVPEVMGYGEAWRLLTVLLREPSSQSCAALAGWSFPVSRGDLVLRDLYDLQHMSKAKNKPKAYPRPWDVEPTRHGGGIGMTVEEFEKARAATTS